MVNDPMYDEWIADRRAVKPPRNMTDQVMAAVEARDTPDDGHVHLAVGMNESSPVRWAACLAAMLVGSLPFLYVAYVAQFLVY